ncbi:hypothetical protein LOC68_18095 [Blastopirellula sp. JC732]|uniref:Uncharacterized protein n=1 Tax=Blastopirellula sediminis TaxID=2894196 RepID=A0A9X1SGL2_9BACT|nr:hypothetical protein [Blastopirellula sediminis]MCC9606392.1 hypothetical protein [Blastopirellula sediminis]MCC9630310.1 hypothetical protein [Blastopirellula sediminis]
MAILVRLSLAFAFLMFLAAMLLPGTTGASPDFNKRSETRRALSHMEINVLIHRDGNDRVPGDTVEELVANLEIFGADFEGDEGKLLKDGVDGWGRPLVLVKTGSSNWVIRSLGANGVDDHGREDDIETELEVAPRPVRPVSTSRSTGVCGCGAKKEVEQEVHSSGDDPQPTLAPKLEA